MTISFNSNFKNILINKLKEKYQEELLENEENKRKEKQMENFRIFLVKYFKEIENELKDVLDIDGIDISFEKEDIMEIVRLKINKNYISFKNTENNSIILEIGVINNHISLLESKTIGYIVPGDTKPVFKIIGKIHEGGHFDENTINFYLKEVFINLFK